jgi:hypothetical protein
MKKAALGLLSLAFFAGSAFFCYYTVRLIYINVSGQVAHRAGGMYIGFVAFPLATIIFGGLGWLCIRASRT